MRIARETMLLYAVTDRAWTGKESLYDQVEKALKGGVTCVQLREKELAERDFLEEAVHIRDLCRRYRVPFLINDNVDIALACDADGVHVGQKDMEASRARKLLGEGRILGVSVHTAEEAKRALEGGADYLGAGAVFATRTKTDTKPLSLETLRDIREAVELPVVAIGGICQENMMELAGSGVDGVALVSAIFSAEDIEGRCRILKAMSEEAFGFAGYRGRGRSRGISDEDSAVYRWN